MAATKRMTLLVSWISDAVFVAVVSFVDGSMVMLIMCLVSKELLILSQLVLMDGLSSSVHLQAWAVCKPRRASFWS